MKRHAFGFATAVDSATLTGNSADSARYRQEVLRNFNKVAIENDLKWPFFETWAAGRFERAEQWLRANGMTDIHAHVLVWPGRRNLPADVVAMLDRQPVDTAALRERVNTHIDQMMNVTRDKVTEWDVLNEPFDNKDLQAVLGNGEMAEWFKRARRANPNVLLFLNDYDIVERGGYFFGHMNYTFDVLQQIKRDGGPVDGFGFQSHFNRNLTNPGRAYEVFEKFGAEVDVLQVTEFDVNLPDEELKALYLRDYLTVAFSHPKMNGFTLWGFWAGRHWLPDAALIKRDWTPTKSLEVWRELIYKQWWTDVEGVTGEDGVFRVRGFLGEYEVVNGETTKALSLKRGEKGVVEFVAQ
jgi:endo-1,4-beta-xylanase